MENYEIIKSYLETFPEDTEVKTIIESIKNAEKKSKTSLYNIQAKMEKNIGKCYFYTDFDDCVSFMRIYTKITGTKILDRRNVVLYTATSIEISEGAIYYLKDVTFAKDDLKENKLIDSSIFDEVERKYMALYD